MKTDKAKLILTAEDFSREFTQMNTNQKPDFVFYQSLSAQICGKRAFAFALQANTRRDAEH
jgi:hypothetical protein